MKVAVMTDTNCGLTPAEGKKKGLYVIPRTVTIDGQLLREGESLTREMLYDAIAKNKEIFTLEPSAYTIKSTWDAILAEGYDCVMYVPMSSNVNDEYDASVRLAKDYGKKVVIVDNKRISISQLNSVLDAKYMADQGVDVFDIKSVLDFNASRNVLFLAADDTKRISKSDLFPGAVGTIDAMRNVKPIYKMTSAKPESFSKGKGAEGCAKIMIEAIRKEIENDRGRTPINCMCIGVSSTYSKPEDEEKWVRVVKNAFKDYSVLAKAMPCNIACEVGLNAIGISLERVERDLTKD